MSVKLKLVIKSKDTKFGILLEYSSFWALIQVHSFSECFYCYCWTYFLFINLFNRFKHSVSCIGICNYLSLKLQKNYSSIFSKIAVMSLTISDGIFPSWKTFPREKEMSYGENNNLHKWWKFTLQIIFFFFE